MRARHPRQQTKFLPPKLTLHPSHLYVLPQDQNKGFGTKLLHFACSKCTAEPTLWILQNNENAARLYRREGFVETGRRNVIDRGLDEIEFKKHII